MYEIQNHQILEICLEALVRQLTKEDYLVQSVSKSLENDFKILNEALSDNLDFLSKADLNTHFWHKRPEHVWISYETQTILILEFCSKYEVQNVPDYFVKELERDLIIEGNSHNILTSLLIAPNTSEKLSDSIKLVLKIFKEDFTAFHNSNDDLIHKDDTYISIILRDVNKGIINSIYNKTEVENVLFWIEKIIEEPRRLRLPDLLLLLSFDRYLDLTNKNKKYLKEKINQTKERTLIGINEPILLKFIELLHNFELFSHRMNKNQNKTDKLKNEPTDLETLLESLAGYKSIDKHSPRGKIIESLKLKNENQKESLITIYEDCYDKSEGTYKDETAWNTINSAVKDLNKKLGFEIIVHKSWDVWWQAPTS